MESNPLRGLFGVSSPRPVEQRVAPQPTEPTENIYFEIPSGMIEKLLANPFTGDGTLHPDLHLIYVDEVCGLFKLAGMPECRWERHLCGHWDPFYGRRARGCVKSRSDSKHTGRLPRFGPRRCVIP